MERIINSDKLLITLGVLLAGGALVFDLVMPLGVAGGIPYVALVLLSLWMSDSKFSVTAGIIASVLVLIGYELSPSGDVFLIELINRLLALFGIWTAVFFILKYKQTEKVARDEQESAQLYLDIAGTMFVVLDKNQKIKLINQKGLEILGYQEEELIGKKWFDLLVPEAIREEVKELFNQLMKGEQVPTEYHENSVLTKSGEERLIAWHNTVIRDDNGDIKASLSSGEDITLQKESEKNLQQVENSLRSLHSITTDNTKNLEDKINALLRMGCNNFNLPIGILAKIEGDQYFVQYVQDSNYEARAEIYHKSFELDHTFCKTVLEQSEPLCIEHVTKSEWRKHPFLRTSRLEAYIGIAVNVNNELYGTINFSCKHPRDISFTSTDREILKLLAEWVGGEIQRDQMQHNLHLANDLLESKVKSRTSELEQALREIQNINLSIQEESKMRKKAEEKANSALVNEKELGELKSRFVSMASHEFRTPLSGVLTSASLIARYDQPEHQDKRERHVGIIKESVSILTGILNDFLSLEKLESGKIESKPELFDLDDFTRETAAGMGHMFKKGQHVNYKNDLSNSKVFLDQQLLRTVLNNMLTNALKYSPENKIIDLAIKGGDKEIIIEVQDRGIGIPEKDEEHMFERFYRASNATNISGTGLGLNITKKHVELMGGSITFKSEENVGTKFIVKLPHTDIKKHLQLNT